MAARRAKSEVCARYGAAPPGVEVPCRSRLLGREVPLRGGGVGKVVGCAVPRPRASADPKKRCAPDFLVRNRLGLVLAEDGPRLKDRARPRQALCDQVAPFPARHGIGARIAREGYAEGELPFPHRRAGSVCCAYHGLYPETVARELDAVEDGRGDVREFVARVGAQVLRVKDLRAAVGPVRSLGDVARVVEATRAHCGALVEQWDAARSSRYRSHATEQRARAATLKRRGATDDEIADEVFGGRSRRRKT